MTTFNRRSALLRANTYAYNSWQIVKQWIKDMVRIEPTIMRKVAKMKFGAMGSWMEAGGGKIGRCGCLVGSCAIAMVEERNSFVISPAHDTVWVRSQGEEKGLYVEPYQVVAELAKKQFHDDMVESADAAGMAAYRVTESFEDETEGVELLKSEILYQLRLRAKRRAK